MAAVTVQEFVCSCVFALPESPSDGGITGLSNQQMQTAENNIIRKPQRGILGGPSAHIRSDKESRDSGKLAFYELLRNRLLLKIEFIRFIFQPREYLILKNASQTSQMCH